MNKRYVAMEIQLELEAKVHAAKHICKPCKGASL